MNEKMKMNYVKFNNHPKGLETDDCVVRSISKAFEKDYLETRRDLNRMKRKLGFQSYKETKFIYKYLSEFKRIIIKVEKGQPRLKGYDFLEKYSKGTYLLNMAGHITVVVDGILYDLWDCRHKTVYTAWKLK